MQNAHAQANNRMLANITSNLRASLMLPVFATLLCLHAIFTLKRKHP